MYSSGVTRVELVKALAFDREFMNSRHISQNMLTY